MRKSEREREREKAKEWRYKRAKTLHFLKKEEQK